MGDLIVESDDEHAAPAVAQNLDVGVVQVGEVLGGDHVVGPADGDPPRAT